MALHTETEIYRAIFDLAGEAADVILQMRRDVKPVFGKAIMDNCLAMELDVRAATINDADLFATANSYFGLLRQASHSHADRVRLANLLRKRGRCINAALTKTYRTSPK